MFLLSNQELFVSDEDVDLLIRYKWKLHRDGFVMEDLSAYEDDLPEANRKPHGYLLLHHEIFKRIDPAKLPLKATERVKHLNANFLDNRRDNLGIGNWVETDPEWWESYQKWRDSIKWLDKFM